MSNTSKITSVEFNPDGTAFIKITKTDNLGVETPHRTSVPPGVPVVAQMKAVNDHLVQMGYPAIPAAEVAKLKTLIDPHQPPDIVSRYVERSKQPDRLFSPQQIKQATRKPRSK